MFLHVFFFFFKKKNIMCLHGLSLVSMLFRGFGALILELMSEVKGLRTIARGLIEAMMVAK